MAVRSGVPIGYANSSQYCHTAPRSASHSQAVRSQGPPGTSRVDGRRNGLAYSTADRGEQTDEGEHGGDVLVGRGGHDCHLLADDERAAAEGDEDLAHDYVADALIGLPEVDHQADAENLEA